MPQGAVIAPTSWIISTILRVSANHWWRARRLLKSFDPTDVFVDWYVPNERLSDPKVGNEVFVLFGNRRISGQIMEILPISDVYAGSASAAGGRIAIANRAHSVQPGHATPGAEFDGRRSHALHQLTA